MYKQNIFNTTIAATGTFFTWLFGTWDTALKVLILFMILDYTTGIIKGIVNKRLSSYIGFKGIAKKAVILIVLIVAVMLDRLLNTGNWVFRSLVAYFYIANEGISLIENCTQLGVPVPEKLKESLIQIKNKEQNK